MTRTIEERTAAAIHLWERDAGGLPELGRRFTPEEQRAKEALFDVFAAALEAELVSAPGTRAGRSAAHSRITSAFAEFARHALDLDECHIALLLNDGFPAIGTVLGRLARRFDKNVSTAEILQACRNAWAACGLQSLFGMPMCVTPAIFGYSMLYPYTDNYLDDAAVTREQKLRFSEQFRQRLAGGNVPAANSHEESIWNLVSLIESSYARADYPEVYASLLAIHRSQEESIRLLEHGGAEEARRVVFTKGGASVLADAYLAAGRLTEDQAGFAFDWGVLLQLGDDLQDVREDSAKNLRTVFSAGAEHAPLDALTNRTLHFAIDVFGRMENLHSAPRPLRELIRRSSISLIVRAAGALRECFSAAYIAEMETYSPFRFEFIAERRERMARRRGRLGLLFETFLAADEDEPVFPMLPNSLFL